MMRIAINNNCNSNCPYCFAGKMGIDETTNMSLENVRQIFDFMVLNQDRNLIILGGEPTLHPQFKEIIELANLYQAEHLWTILILTNGILLDKYIDIFSEKTHFLININSPHTLRGIETYNKMKKSLRSLYKVRNLSSNNDKRISLGCNLCAEITDYSFFWEIIDEFNCDSIRVSVASPQNNNYINDRDSYFKLMKPVFLDFIIECGKRGVLASTDCSLIPPCYFSGEEMYLVLNNSKKIYDVSGMCCSIIYQVLPDMTISCCFGNKNFKKEKKKLFDFINKKQIDEYFYNIASQNMITERPKRCGNCLLGVIKCCMGGCLGFKDEK